MLNYSVLNISGFLLMLSALLQGLELDIDNFDVQTVKLAGKCL